MNPIPYSRDSPDFYACGECGVVAQNEYLATKCCVPPICECGEPVEKYRTACRSCINKHSRERRAGRHDKAKKVKLEDYDGPVYDEESDQYYANPDLWIEDCDENERDPTDGWTCIIHTVHLDIDDALGTCLEETYENAYWDDVDGLKAFVKEWNEKQSCKYWLQGNFLLVVMADRPGQVR